MIPDTGTGIRGQELDSEPGNWGQEAGSAQKRLGIGIPNPRTNLGRTEKGSGSPVPRNWYLVPGELGSRIQTLESLGLETGIPEPRY
jgi:hypothetical protein